MPQLRCSHFYADCGFVMRGATEDEVLSAAAVHGREVHGEDPDAWSADEIAEMRAKIEA